MTERDANLLGYLGVLPMAFAAFVLWLSPGVFSQAFAASYLQWTLYYAAIILSFMGGARWSLAMMSPEARPDEPLSGLLAAVIPALLAWAAAVPWTLVQAPYTARFGVLGLGFVLILVEDLRGARAGDSPAWYGALRGRLTFWVLLSLGFVLLKLIVG